MEEDVKTILEAWKKAREHNNKEIKKICKKYKVKEKVIEYDEGYTTYAFENGVEFTCPHDENYDDYDLTGDALKFAEKYNDINQESYHIANQEIQDVGFEEEDNDEYYKVWRKEGKIYSVTHYAKKEDDVEVSKEK